MRREAVEVEVEVARVQMFFTPSESSWNAVRPNLLE